MESGILSTAGGATGSAWATPITLKGSSVISSAETASIYSRIKAAYERSKAAIVELVMLSNNTSFELSGFTITFLCEFGLIEKYELEEGEIAIPWVIPEKVKAVLSKAVEGEGDTLRLVNLSVKS